jgi:hypothetical protein
MQAVKVLAVSGNTVTIAAPGIYMPNWKASLSPQAWWFGGTLERSGIEDMSVTNVAGSDHQISFVNARDSWVKNIASYNAGGEHVRTYMASNVEVRHSYFYGTVNAASQSYGVNWYWAWNGRAEDNIFEKVTSPVVLEAGSEGHVTAYNFCTNMYYTVSPDWLIESMTTHGAHGAFNLFEGNYTTNIYLDFIHGSGSHNTLFRNRLIGWEQGKSSNTYPIALEAMNHDVNVVGNVLGKAGYHTSYECANAPCDTSQAIYYLGYQTTSGTYDASYDTRVRSTLIRHGNYDVVHAGIVWDPNITTTALPASEYRATKPPWFGDRAWPPIDPAAPSDDPTQIPAGYRFTFGQDPPGAVQ